MENHVSHRVKIRTPVMEVKLTLNLLIALWTVFIFQNIPAIIHAIIAGNEIEIVDPNRMLCRNIADEHKITFGDTSEWLYRGTNNKINVKNATTER